MTASRIPFIDIGQNGGGEKFTFNMVHETAEVYEARDLIYIYFFFKRVCFKFGFYIADFLEFPS